MVDDGVARALALLYLQVVRTSTQQDVENVASLGALQIIQMLSAELVGQTSSSQPSDDGNTDGNKDGNIDGNTALYSNIRRDSDATIATMRQEIARLSILLNEHQKSEQRMAERVRDAEAALRGGTAAIRAKLEAEMQAAGPAEVRSEKMLGGLQGQVQQLSAENSALRHQLVQLRSQLKSYETKLRSLTLTGDGAMRSAMLEKHEQLRKVSKELETAYKELERARLQQKQAVTSRTFSNGQSRAMSTKSLFGAFKPSITYVSSPRTSEDDSAKPKFRRASTCHRVQIHAPHDEQSADCDEDQGNESET